MIDPNLLEPHGLFVMGALHHEGDTLVVLGAGPGLWPVFTDAPEFSDGAADPLDRWSKRVIGRIAAGLGGTSHYPSDGPPYLPFIAWAKKTGRFWQSPTGMLIHDEAGLMISIRGVVRLPELLEIDTNHPDSPCLTCETRPCETACPVGALSGTSPYDVPRCKTHITSLEGLACLEAGCLVRRICPVSQQFGRDPAQSGFHMRSFIGLD